MMMGPEAIDEEEKDPLDYFNERYNNEGRGTHV